MAHPSSASVVIAARDAAVIERAYSVLRIKAIQPKERRITGIASTPEPDRAGDVIESLGIEFVNPVPLLLFHNTRAPVGLVTFDPPTAEGLTFTADLPTVAEPGTLRDRVEEAWQSLNAGLLPAVSIGFRSLEDTFIRETGAIRFLRTEVVELSLVTVPMNADAKITSVRSIVRAALGARALVVSGATDRSRKSLTMNTIGERITAFENTRAAKHARMLAIMNAAGEKDLTLDAAQTEEYDTLTAEITSVDDHLVRLRALERMAPASATVIAPTSTPEAAPLAEARGGSPIVSVRSLLPKGTAFTRAIQAIAVGRGDHWRAIEWAKQWKETTPEVELFLRAAVAPGTTTDPAWAAPLAALKPLVDEFLELLRPATLLGKMSGSFMQVPFNVSVASQTGGGTYGWVGQAGPKPVTKLAFGTVTLGIAKCAGIVVITEELARVSTPSAEAAIRTDMVNGIAQFLDVEFTDPAKAPVANVSPGSITNGITPITTAGTSPANARTDILALAAALTAANIPPSSASLIMSETNALALGAALNPLGQPLFPGVGPTGGTVLGFPCYASQSAGNNVIMVAGMGIMYADDGGVTIDVSREASVQMDSAPDNPPVATSVLVSLWQENLIGLRAERFVNWKRARTGSVQYTVATYTA